MIKYTWKTKGGVIYETRKKSINGFFDQYYDLESDLVQAHSDY